LIEVYDKIFEVLEEKRAPKRVVSLVAVHALFQLLDTNPEEARRFCKKVDIDDPLLYPCARLATLERKAKSLRQREYSQLVQFFDDSRQVAAYLGDSAICSLESDVHRECLKVFEFEQMYESKKLNQLAIFSLPE